MEQEKNKNHLGIYLSIYKQLVWTKSDNIVSIKNEMIIYISFDTFAKEQSTHVLIVYSICVLCEKCYNMCLHKESNHQTEISHPEFYLIIMHTTWNTK